MQLFSEIMVVPFRALCKPPSFGDGGPHRRSFVQQTTCRHNRIGTPVDWTPTPVTDVPPLETGTFVRGGFLHAHFGHLITGPLPHLPVSPAHRPDDSYPAGTTPSQDQEPQHLPGRQLRHVASDIQTRFDPPGSLDKELTLWFN